MNIYPISQLGEMPARILDSYVGRCFLKFFFYSRGSNSINFYSEHLAKEADSAFSGGSNVQCTAAGLREYEEN